MTALSRHRSFLGCAALLALSAGWNVGVRLAAQSAGGENILDQAIVTAFKWRSIGPDRGGRSIAVSGVKGRPREGYFGATGGGLWKTIDGGAKWAPVTDGQIRSASVGAVAVSESKPDIVFIGTGESCIRGNIMPGDGVYKSADAGKTWTHSGFSNSDAISKIRIHPTNPDVVFVADFGRYGAPSDERGLYKSTDGGKTWQRKLFRDGKTGAVDVEIDRRNPNVLFAAMWEAYRVEYQMSSGGPGSGLFKSTDGGDTWREITRNPGLPQGMVGKISIAISGADSNRVYALVENENGGLFSSDDAGATWKLVNTGRNIRQRAFYYTHVFADPNNRDIVYALNTSAFRSTDGGKTLAQIGQGTHGDHHDLWIDPGDSQHVILGNDGGGAITYNVAAPQRSWSRQDFPTEQFYHVITTRHAPFHVCGAQQDNSTLCVPSNNGLGRGGGGGGGVQPFYPVGGGEPGYIAPDPKDVDVFFAGANNGSFLTRFNRRTGEQREVGPYPRFFSGENSASVVERWQWTYPIIFSPVDPNVLYTSSQRVWKTTNGGQTWDAISGDLTRHDPKTMQDSGGPITHDMNSPEIYATIFSLGPGKTDVNVIWAGSDDGIVQVTRDGGRNWTNVTPKDMPDLGRVSQIDASAFDAGTAYIAVKKPLLTDFNPYIFRTHDFGRTWTKIVTGIPARDYTHVVREDPVRRGMLYAGTQHGFYLSYDDGDRWQALGSGLPDTPVSDIWVEANDIAIATHGRGFYVLDEVGPLRQYGSAVTSATDAYLFKPGDAIRSGGPARITYWLKRPAQNLTLEILDSNGQAIRTFAGRAGGSGESGGAGRSGGTGGSVVAGASGGAGAAGQPAAVATNTAAANTTAEAEQPPADEEEGGGRGADRVDGGRRDALQLGSAVRAGHGVPGHGALGRDDERSDRAPGHVPGAAHGGRPRDDAADHGEEASVLHGQRRGSARAVRAGEPDSRQGERGQRRDHPDPPHQAAARGSRAEIPERGRQGDRRAVHEGAGRGRGRRLPGAQSEQPGSAQLPDQDQQPPGIAAARRPGGRRQAGRQRRADLQRSAGGAEGGDRPAAAGADDVPAAVQSARATAGHRGDQRKMRIG